MGPRFNCMEVDAKKTLSGACNRGSPPDFEAKDMADDNSTLHWLYNNSFQLVWDTASLDETECDSSTFRALDCSISLATYNFGITTDADGSRTITTEIIDDNEIWTNDKPIDRKSVV